MKTNIEAGKHFGIDTWSKLRHAAFRLALQELAVDPVHQDVELIRKLSKRFKIGAAFAFYSQNKEML